MNKFFTKIVASTLITISIFTVSTTASTFTNKPTELNHTQSNMVISLYGDDVVVEDITREEYVENYSKEKGISYEEADKLEKLETEDSIKKEIESKKSREVVSPREVVYKQVTKRFNTGSSAFSSEVIVVIHVKINRYHAGSSGTYQKFSQVTDKGADAYGSGTASFNPIALTTDIGGDYGNGNYIYMMLSGNLEHQTTYSGSFGASGAGFSVEVGSGGIYYCRKYISKNHTFSSNWDLTK